MAWLRTAVCLLLPSLLCACAGGAMPGLLGGADAPKVGMAGRWMLQAPNAPMCGLNFGESGDGRSGRIVPEGGCPANFYTSRRWIFEGGALTIVDDNGDPLGQMTLAGERFDGKAANGISISLARPITPPTE